LKRLIWIGSSKKDLTKFSDEGMRKAGYELYNVQAGIKPDDWKPMPSIGPGVEEIRIHAENEYRVIYIARFEDAVYVLHCFVKKTQKTLERDIFLTKARLKKLMEAKRKT
jgi:phage-related protein